MTAIETQAHPDTRDGGEQPHLFTPLTLRGVSLRNRIVVSPMCMYSSVDGFATDWHVVHLGSRAVGGAGLVVSEATAVTAEGRISPQDLGIWKDEHVPTLARITAFIKAQGGTPGIQLAHAGRKASAFRPWSGSGGVPAAQGGWQPAGPSAIAYNDRYILPHELTPGEIAGVVEAFAAGAKRSLDAGFEVIELHAAHGYLLHEFLSPAANRRTDQYGGSAANRQRLIIEVVDAIRSVWPADLPLFVRLSATDWLPEDVPGWRLTDSIALAAVLREHGVDVIDVSSGGLSPAQKLTPVPGYQVPFAQTIRAEAHIQTAAVGLITQPQHADAIVRDGQADLVALARELLRDPYWPLHAARALGHAITWPAQYERARD